MFKLRRLEITGFKSFADHTDLIFTGDGITGVVGPNGCGKSNVADAIAWVLGEQRIKHLRGAEMKDVIFQGSRNTWSATRSSSTNLTLKISIRPSSRSTNARRFLQKVKLSPKRLKLQSSLILRPKSR